MKLHQIVVSGNRDEIYPNGHSYKDFNLNVIPFFQFVSKGLGRVKDFLNIKKLNITLFSNPNSSGALINYPEGKGFISMVNKGGFNFEEYFQMKPVGRIIILAEITKAVLIRINPNPKETNTLLKILDYVIEVVPTKEKQIK